MKAVFYLGITGIILYEIAKVYFIMPMPGSQQMNSIDLAYFLHSWRWTFRGLFWIMIVAGAFSVFSGKTKWAPLVSILLATAVTYAANYQMAADTMFYQPNEVILYNASLNKVGNDRLVIGTEANGDPKAYPIQYIGYHHQVQDVIGGKPVIVTYCTVCRTGRVFEPVVNGKKETFRLVGMDHFNAMFEDATTGSWWRQANGEAIAGPLKGHFLPELASTQTTLAQWVKMHPDSKIMQPDPVYQAKYDSMSRYESGKGKSELTRTDTVSWKEKSWVVGIKAGEKSKAFDWNRLKKERIVNDQVGAVAVALVIAADNRSFFAFDRERTDNALQIRNDTLFTDHASYNLLGKRISGSGKDLKRINAYQEFWHSWRTFHPGTKQY
ncbi:DUF3179 domain-containing (seleno)protein [Dyadobacter sediminis]|uniref:DUF3179 domain-containing protein n=1 Tax=Dyadobacter sediminis TaxID=1493691 RepID=A0A5R9KDY0_9BACT|nr:DUF3179 domain-containing (seleno)protein [Dyadobacter sediminis]TLU94267.1 DUF3179 domain-containing protein [Dyadobacter sediminis]GGB92759.1 hypothetical protein GCM10011325_20240 [Dyadobacter sediminis]